MLIGLTGKREVGKSSFARILQERYRFAAVHGFGPGRDMCVAYYRACGLNDELAVRMVYGDLKDTPCPQLPGGVSSRFFMEKLGRFMGQDLGPDWTAGVEVARTRRSNPDARLVVESLVYEGKALITNHGCIVVRLVRSNHSGVATEYSDLNQQDVPYHYWLDNSGDLKHLQSLADELLRTILIDKDMVTPPLDSHKPLSPLREINVA